MTANGQPDQSRSARLALKDYVNGKLLYCTAPPAHDQAAFHTFPERQKDQAPIESLPPRQQRAIKMDKSQVEAINEDFFQTKPATAYIQGRNNFPNIRPSGSLAVTNPMASYTGSVNGSMVSLAGIGEKPWKNRKRQPKEKLRKRYAHLDEH